MHVAHIDGKLCGNGDTRESAIVNATSNGAPSSWLSVGVADAALEQWLSDVDDDSVALLVDGDVVSLDR